MILLINWKTCDAVDRHTKKVSGAWVFRDTRVPVSALFENLKDGASIEQFLEWFPGVELWQVETVLDHEVKALADCGRYYVPDTDFSDWA